MSSVESNLYGFSFGCNGVIDNIDKFSYEDNSYLGTYISIKKTEKEILISQDFNGNFGLYYFKNNNRVVFSNSFYYLVEYIRDKERITFNYGYHDALYASDYCSNSFSQTMVNEIKILPRNYIVHIDCFSGKHYFEKIDFKEHSISALSKKGLECLDIWFEKWVDILRSIKINSNNIFFDLSGGFDSRCLITILLNANIDMNQLRVNSFNDKLVCHEEDFAIASEIANFYNFNLNNEIFEHKTSYDNLKNVIDTSVYAKLCSHKEFYFRPERYDNPVFKFSGDGGECMRNYWYRSYFLTLKRKLAMCRKYFSISKLRVFKFFNCEIKVLSKHIKVSILNPLISSMLYAETRCRYHYGRYAVEDFFGNIFRLQPLLDPDLRKLNCTKGFLFKKESFFCALVYDRYAPDLLNFRFEGGRHLDEKLLKKIKKFNAKYPYKKRDLSFVSSTIDILKNNQEKSVDLNLSPYDYFRDLFFSEEFKVDFTKYFSSELYEYIAENKKKAMNVRNPSFRDIYTAYGALEVMKSCEMSAGLRF